MLDRLELILPQNLYFDDDEFFEFCQKKLTVYNHLTNPKQVQQLQNYIIV